MRNIGKTLEMLERISKKVVIESGHTPTSQINTYRMEPSEILPGVAIGLLLKQALQEEGTLDIITTFYGDDYNSGSFDDFYERGWGYPRTVDHQKVMDIMQPDQIMSQSQMKEASTIMLKYMQHFAQTEEVKPSWNKRVVSYVNGGENIALMTCRVKKKSKNVVDEEPSYSCPLMTAAWTAFKTGLLPSVKDVAKVALPPVLSGVDYHFLIQTLFAPEITTYSRNKHWRGVAYSSVTVLPEGLKGTERESKVLLSEMGFCDVPDIGVYFDPSEFKWLNGEMKGGSLPEDFDYQGAVRSIFDGLQNGSYGYSFHPSVADIMESAKQDPKFVILKR